MARVGVRYIVDDVDAVELYGARLGFREPIRGVAAALGYL